MFPPDPTPSALKGTSPKFRQEKFLNIQNIHAEFGGGWEGVKRSR